MDEEKIIHVNKLIENDVMLIRELRGRRNCTLVIKGRKNFQLNKIICEQIKLRNIKLIFT